jgi:RND superfamily putative drug exporter
MSSPETEQPSTRSRRPWFKRPLFWAILVLLVWFGLGSVLGPLAGKLSEVQKNDNASFLPPSAESTKVLDLQTKFSQAQTFPVFLLFTRDSGLTTEDKAAVAQFAQQIPTLHLTDDKGVPIPQDKTVGDYLVPGPLVPVPSQDGKAMLISVPLDSTEVAVVLDNGKSPIVVVAQTLAHASENLTPGLTRYVTGPGGILADLFKVFGSLDTTLLGITGLVVAVILIIVYRSPVLWFIPLLSAIFALSSASGVIYLLAKNDVLTLNGQSQGILTVLVFGAATDYALLLVARYREELHRFDDPFEAMRSAWRGVLEPLSASAATVSIGLLCLLFSELNSNKSTGPVAAIGIVCAYLATMTILPALLVLPSVAVYLLGTIIGFVLAAVAGVPGVGGIWALVLLGVFVFAGVTRRRGRGPSWAFWLSWPRARWVFWPRVPRYLSEDEKLTGIWSRGAAAIGRRPRTYWVVTALALLVAAFFVTTLHADGLSQANSFTSRPDSVVGQEVLGQHFPAGSGNPAVIIANASSAEAVAAAAAKVPGVEAVVPFTGEQGPPTGTAPPKVVDGLVQFEVTLSEASDSLAAEQTVRDLRAALADVPGANALVGGFSAINLDTQEASKHDRTLIIPIVLLVILLILMLLLRAVVAPVLLVLTVVLSFAATLGVCAVVFTHLFHFAGADTAFPLFAFTFLVALGVDYNIFLMTRVREESLVLGTRPGILRGLTVTGGVITSAGVVLAATFSVLGTLPLVFLAELGFAVAFGVLLDTLVVRSILVPALAYDVGRPIWWPSRLARLAEPGPGPGPGEIESERVGV